MRVKKRERERERERCMVQGFVQIEIDDVGVHLHYLVGSADLKPPYIKSVRGLTVSSSLMGPLAQVLCEKFAEILQKMCRNLRSRPDPSPQISVEVFS